MPFDEKVRDRVKLALEGIPKVKEKKFFNGAVSWSTENYASASGRLRSCSVLTLQFMTN
jgi:hypothetical protein